MSSLLSTRYLSTRLRTAHRLRGANAPRLLRRSRRPGARRRPATSAQHAGPAVAGRARDHRRRRTAPALPSPIVGSTPEVSITHHAGGSRTRCVAQSPRRGWPLCCMAPARRSATTRGAMTAGSLAGRRRNARQRRAGAGAGHLHQRSKVDLSHGRDVAEDRSDGASPTPGEIFVARASANTLPGDCVRGSAARCASLGTSTRSSGAMPASRVAS